MSPHLRKGVSVARHKRNPVNTVRNLIIGIVAGVALVVAGYGIFYSAGGSITSEFVEGEHFTRTDNDKGIDDAAPADPGATIVVTEFFSYYCVHCKNFDPFVEEWRENLPDGVRFERSPVAFSPVWELLGQTYYVLEEKNALEQNHARLFRAIHDNGKQFLSVDALADFIDGHGVSRDEFIRAFNSPTVRRKMNAANRRARDLAIRAVPTLVVGDQYVVETAKVGRRNAFEVVEFLIEKIRTGDADA